MSGGIKIFTPELAAQERNKMIEEFTQLAERYHVRTGVFILFQENEITQFTTNQPGSRHAHLGGIIGNAADQTLRTILANKIHG